MHAVKSLHEQKSSFTGTGGHSQGCGRTARSAIERYRATGNARTQRNSVNNKSVVWQGYAGRSWAPTAVDCLLVGAAERRTLSFLHWITWRGMVPHTATRSAVQSIKEEDATCTCGHVGTAIPRRSRCFATIVTWRKPFMGSARTNRNDERHYELRRKPLLSRLAARLPARSRTGSRLLNLPGSLAAPIVVAAVVQAGAPHAECLRSQRRPGARIGSTNKERFPSLAGGEFLPRLKPGGLLREKQGRLFL